MCADRHLPEVTQKPSGARPDTPLDLGKFQKIGVKVLLVLVQVNQVGISQSQAHVTEHPLVLLPHHHHPLLLLPSVCHLTHSTLSNSSLLIMPHMNRLNHHSKEQGIQQTLVEVSQE